MPTQERARDRVLLVVPAALVLLGAILDGSYYSPGRPLVALGAALALVVAVCVQRRPLVGVPPVVWAGAATLAAFAGWALWSQAWSIAPLGAPPEAQRTAVYVTVLVLYAVVRPSTAGIELLMGTLALAIAGLGAEALVTTKDKVFALHHLAGSFVGWNAFGMLAGLGLLLAARVAMRRDRLAPVAAALVVVDVAVLAASGARSGMAVTGAALAVYSVLVRPPRLIATVVAVAPAAALAVLAEGTAWLYAVALLLAAGLRMALADRAWTLPRWSLAAVTGATLVGLLIAFVSVLSNDGRRAYWHVVHLMRSAEPWHGQGAGSFRTFFRFARTGTDINAVDAHSLLLETSGELGVVGVALLVAAIGLVLGALALRAWRTRAEPVIAVLAVFVAWLVHALVNVDYERPALSLVPFALAGAVLARPVEDADVAGGRLGAVAGRVVVIAACVALAIPLARDATSGVLLARAQDARRAGDCGDVLVNARRALRWGQSAEGHWLRARCEPPERGYEDIRRALVDSPNDAFLRADAAILRARTGRDPLREARRAIALNPNDFVLNAHMASLFSRDKAAIATLELSEP